MTRYTKNMFEPSTTQLEHTDKTMQVILENVRRVEPECLEGLEVSPSTSADFLLSSLINRVKNPELKTALVRMQVESKLHNGSASEALNALEYAHASELNLPDYSEQFVHEKYHAAMDAENYYEAYMIANIMRAKGRRIVKISDEIGDSQTDGITAWLGREETAFNEYATRFLDQWEIQSSEYDISELRSLFDTFLYRKDGYLAKSPSPLARRVAMTLVRTEFSLRRPGPALHYAEQAYLSQQEIQRLNQETKNSK